MCAWMCMYVCVRKREREWIMAFYNHCSELQSWALWSLIIGGCLYLIFNRNLQPSSSKYTFKHENEIIYRFIFSAVYSKGFCTAIYSFILLEPASVASSLQCLQLLSSTDFGRTRFFLGRSLLSSIFIPLGNFIFNSFKGLIVYPII